jgi:hypothetical protein
VAGFLLELLLLFLMGVVTEVEVSFFLEEGVVTFRGEVFVTVGFEALPGGDLLPVVEVEDRLDPVGDTLPDEGGLGLLLDLEDLMDEVNEATEDLLGGGGGDCGGKLRGGGGGGGEDDGGGGGEVRLLGGVVTLFPNCDWRALKFLVERVLAATCLPPWVGVVLLPEGGVAGLFFLDSKIEIRSLSAFLTAGELILSLGISMKSHEFEVVTKSLRWVSNFTAPCCSYY